MSETASQSTQLLSRDTKLGAILVLLALTWPASVWLGTSLHAWRLHGNTTYPESAIVQNALLAAQDGHLYRPLTAPPYTPAAYGPFYYGVLAAIARVGSLDHQGLLEAGRLVSFAGFSGILALLYFWARRFGLSPLHASIGAAFYAALQDTAPLNVSVRPDMPALCLILCGFYLSTKETLTDRTVLLASLCFATALSVKQSFVAAPTAVMLFLLFQKRYRWAAMLMATGIAWMAVCFLVPILSGDPVFSNLASLRHTVMDAMGELEIVLYELFYPSIHAPLLACGCLGVLWIWKKSGAKIILAYLALAACFGVLAGAHVGASLNSYLEFWTVVTLLAAFGVRWICDKGGVPALCVLAAALTVCAANPATGLNVVNTQAIHEMPDLTRITNVVAGRNVLADDPYLAAQSANPIMLDMFVNSVMEQNGVWDAKPVVDQITAQKFEVVLITVQNRFIRVYRGIPFLSASIHGAITSHYAVRCHLVKAPGYTEFAVLTPNDKPMSAELVMQLQQAGCK